MNRNQSSYYTNLPVPSLPRHRHDRGVVNDLVSFKHGHLILVNARMVYPHSTFERVTTELITVDTSLHLPLDDIVLDTYDFFVPLRVIDKDFEKVFGDVDAYDTTQYFFPEFELDFSASNPLTHDTLLNGAGWRAPVAQLFDYDTTNHCWIPKTSTTRNDKINPWPLMAYYEVYNSFFRDENVDPIIPYADMINSKLSSLTGALFNNLEALPVNRLHDMFSSGLISPQKMVNGLSQVTIPLGTLAPVKTGNVDYDGGSSPQPLRFKSSNTGLYSGAHDLIIAPQTGVSNATALWGINASITPGSNDRLYPSNLYADLSQASAASIEQLRIAFSIQQYAEVKSKFGTRMVEHYQGVWGLTVPDYLLHRPEYLGGHRCTLNNVAVLDQSNLLGNMAGFSSTRTNDAAFTKSFFEYGIIIRVACCRVNHTFSQGRWGEILDLKEELDMYNRFFANIGNIGVKNKWLYNNWMDGSNEQNFNYNESWFYLRTDVSTGAGDFGPNHGDSTELYQKWSYQDIYASRPTFSASWLKEDPSNVYRTLTGRLLPNATNSYGHQYMAAFLRHDFVTMPLPSHPRPSGLTNRI